MAEASAPRQPPLGKHLWPAFGKPRVPGDILFWPRDDQRVLGIPIKFTHWAVYVGRRKLARCCTRWEVEVCETTGSVIPESVVHLWGAADSATRDTSADAVVVHNRLDELGGVPYDGNLEYDKRHTPRRPEQILRRVLVSLGTQKLYETRFGKYHVVGNNCEHFATWSRYGVNRSDQIGDAVKWIGAGLGAVGLGAPGALIGGYAADSFVRSTHLSRRNEIFEKESELFENTDGCEFADDDKEVDWVVECLVRCVEDRERREEAERAAHASGRAHLPRGVPYASDSSAAHNADAVFVDGVALHADAPESAGALLERLAALNGARAAEAAASRAAAEPGSREPREVFSVDSAGNLGGVFGEGLRAFGEGLRGAMRDGEATPTAAAARGEERREGEGGEVERREGERRESRRESSRNENEEEKETPSTTSRDGRRKDPDEQLKDVVSGVGNLLGGMLGGVLKLGGALASEVASQHGNHRRRVEARTDARSRGARGDAPSSNPGPDGERSGLDRPRRGPMVIEELE
jgi:kelch-like protein 24/35